MNAKLLVVLGKTTKRTVSLKLPTVLGRSREADITVAHPLISRRHCEISENNGLLMLHDMGSMNGTMIAGRRIVTAPLLPEAEFTIGPLTFRVLYEYDGDLESVPDTHFLETKASGTAASQEDPAAAEQAEEQMLEFEEALAAEPDSASESGDFLMPDLMALADVDPEEALPAPPVPVRPTVPAGPRRRPVDDDQVATAPAADSLDEPLEIDSSLQSGGHVKESPWAIEEQAIKKPQAKGKPKAPAPPKKPNQDDEDDPGFGDFLAGLE